METIYTKNFDQLRSRCLLLEVSMRFLLDFLPDEIARLEDVQLLIEATGIDR